MQVVVRILNLALGVVVTALVVRTLGSSGYGQWSTIFIVLTLVGYFTNFGMESVALREAARAPEREQEWIGAALMVRLIMLVPVIVVSTLAIVVIHRSQAMLLAGLLLIVTTPFGGAGPLGLLFRLRVNNLVPMLVLTLRSVLWGGSVAIIYWRHGGMIPLAIAMSATNAICSVVQALFALRLVEHWPRPSRAQLGPLLREALPVGLSGVLVIAYARIDQLIVFESAGNKAAGLYSSVYNVVDQAHFIPLSILTTLAPIIAASWPGDRDRMLRTARLTAEMIAIASLGALAFTSVAAVPIVRLLFGQAFVPAATALPVLFAAFVFIAFGYLNGNLLVVMGMQKRLLRISLIALVVNLAGNLVLVPMFGFLAAAWMTLATEVVVFFFSYTLIRRRLELPWPKPGRMGGTVLSAALLAGELTVLKVLGAPLGVLVATTCISYPALLFAFGSLSLDDLRLLIGRERLA
ncbi:MAG: putative polysaccharide biosynthesis protein [Solirubrobacterales bacterium]|jgi:O-antigen/teichoic acid export membrane protein|nr:putative polysaccharide biosynthesis protein [Solirubrobacterales bacterium]